VASCQKLCLAKLPGPRTLLIMHVHLQRQLSVALENHPGRLAGVCRLFADHEVNIEALCVIDNVEQGMVRMIVNDPAGARALLEHAGIPVVEAEVLNLELTDRLGKLARVTSALAEAGVNIEYAYSTVDHAGARTRVILKTSHPRKAQQILDSLRDR
jgi:hypothetical protein